jgi:hypothetical protein
MAFLVLLLGGLAIVGCSQAGGPSEVGKAILMSEEPAGAQDVADFKNSMVSGLGGFGESTIVGRIRNNDKDPWDTSEATFLLTSINLESHDHDDHADCKFCQAKELESMTLVRVVDESGAIIKTDARKLLGLKEKQVVVAQGQGMLADDGALLFDATKVFIRE